MNRHRLKTILTLNVAILGSAAAFASDYVIQSGDTLSTIAHQNFSGPVWGKQGSFAQVLAINPEIKNPNLIFLGQTIHLPANHGLANNESNERQPASEIPSEQNPSQSDVEPNGTASQALVPAQFEEHSALTLAPLFSFSRINATQRSNGAQSILGSDLNLGAEFGWRQFWSESFQTALMVGAESQSYSTTSSTQTLDHSGFLLGSLELEATWGKLRAPQIFTRLGAIQTPFIRGESGTANILDVVTTPNVGLGVSLPLYHSQIFLVSIEGSGDYLAPSSESSYRVNSGYDVEGKLSLSQHSKKNLDQKVAGDLFFKYLNQSTSITTQNDMELGASVQFNFDLFGGETK